MKMKFYYLPLLLLLSGCATLFNGGPDFVPVDSYPEGARILLDGVPVGMTPASIPIPRDSEGVIELEKEGYRKYRRNLDKEINGMVILNIWLLPLCPIGVMIDLFEHNQGKYPNSPIFFQLIPERMP